MSKRSSDQQKRQSERESEPGPGSDADLRSFFPSRALEIGRMYKLVADPQEDQLIRDHAREAIEEFRRLVRSFPDGSRAHAYMVNFGDSALDYAASMRRLDRELEEELRMAHRDRDAEEREALSTAKHGALLKVAFNYLLIGGLFFFIAKSITSPPSPDTTGLDRHAREVAAGMGSIVLAFIGQGLVLSHRLGKVRRRYDRRVCRARRDWALAQVEVHNLALATVEHEWVELTGTPEPLADLARLQIRAVYLGSLSPQASPEDALRGRIAKRARKLLAWRPRRAGSLPDGPVDESPLPAPSGTTSEPSTVR